MLNANFEHNNNMLIDQHYLMPKAVRKWSDIQEDALQRNISIVEYVALPNEENVCLFIDRFEKIDKRRKRLSTKQHLTLLFQQDELMTDKRKDSFLQSIKKIGILVPLNDLKNTDLDLLNHSCTILSSILSRFDAELFFHKVHKWQNTGQILPLPVLLLLDYLEMSINSIIFDQESNIEALKKLNGWFSHFIDEKNTHDKLRLHQFVEYFLLHFDNWITVKNESVKLNKIASKLDPEVISIAEKHFENIEKEILDIEASNKKAFSFSIFESFQKDLASLLMYDKATIASRMIKESSAGSDFIDIVDRYSQDNDKKETTIDSFTKRISSIFSQRTLIDTIETLGSSSTKVDFSLFKNAKQGASFRSEEWNYLLPELTQDQLSQFISSIEKEDELMGKTEQHLKSYLHSIVNQFCLPLFSYPENEHTGFPVFNLLDQQESNHVVKYTIFKKKAEKNEEKTLTTVTKQLEDIYSLKALEDFVADSYKFLFASNRRKLELAFERQKSIILSKRGYRLRKMKELGIEGKISEYAKNLYLDEMLAVEKEIRPFIPFVTKAFLSALPSKKTTEFDPYRRSSTGIEFDPETVNDSEKWIRGDVMKTLRNKTIQGEITQVNCFCLDLSGSMDNKRMRNLFKILYLLVMALETRKSYDAFHFFSNTFIEGVNFSNKFTHKKLLFRILLKISGIFDKKMILYGGLEGTNISDGIEKSLLRMDKFVDDLSRRKPDIQITKSMFVITDGHPSIGIRELPKLNEFIKEKADKHKVAIKGIYIKSYYDEQEFISKIFGAENSVETIDFAEGVQKFVSLMTLTYKAQRAAYKWTKKRKKIFNNIEE